MRFITLWLCLFASRLLAQMPADAGFFVQQQAAAAGGAVYGDVIGAWTSVDGDSVYVAMNKGASNNTVFFNLGVEGATNRSGTPTMYLTITSQGYDSGANYTTLTRNSLLQTVLRKPYPNNTSIDQVGTATAVTNHYGLSRPVYLGDSNITITGSANCYSNCQAFSGVIVTNLSTLFYPKVIGKSFTADHQIVTSNYNISCFGFSPAGKSTNDFWRVTSYQGICSDQHSHWFTSAVYAASAIVSPATNTTAAVPYPRAVIPMSCAGFTVGDIISNYVIMTPILGTNSSILNTLLPATSDNWISAVGKPYMHPILAVCDRLQNLTGRAFVSTAGSASGLVVITNITDWTHPPAAFDTDAHALAALQLTNNASYMAVQHNDAMGYLFHAPGNYTHTQPAADFAAYQAGYTYFIPTPTNTAAVIFNAVTGESQSSRAHYKQCISNCTWSAGSAVGAFYNQVAVWFKDDTFNNITGTSGALIELCNVFLENSYFHNFDQSFMQFGSDNTVFEMVLGNKVDGLFGSSGQRAVQPYNVWGNIIAPTNTFQISTGLSYPGTSYPDGFFIGYNRFPTNVCQGSFIVVDSGSQCTTNGFLICNNVCEGILADNGLSQVSIWIKADDTTGTMYGGGAADNNVSNYRWNAWYNWQAAQATGAVQNVEFAGNVIGHFCTKDDSEAAASANRTNAYHVEFGNACYGNVLLDITNYQNFATASKTFYQDFSGIYTYHPPFSSAWPASDPPQGLYANDYSVFGFKDYEAWQGRATNNLGGGDYHLLASGYFATALPGSGALPFDLEGAAYITNNIPGAYASTK